MHTRRTLLTLLTALFLVASPVLLAQQATPTQQPTPTQEPTPPSVPAATATQPPTFRTGTELVTIDVGVVDRQGQPARGLDGSDFLVTVAGKPRRIVSVEYVDTSTAPPALLAKAPNPDVISTNEGSGVGRLIVFLVDQSSLEPGSVQQLAGPAGRFFERLTFADRSALLLMPVGQNVAFTWNHDRVREALGRVSGLSGFAPEWGGGSLSDARDVALNGNIALRMLADRECGGTSVADASGFGAGGGTQPSPTPVPSPGGGGGGTDGGQSGGGSGGGSGSGSGSGSGTGSGGSGRGTGGGSSRAAPRAFGADRCSDRFRMEAEAVWRQAHMNSMASIAALRQVLARLAYVRGDKTVVFISGGMPLDEREDLTLLSSVAKEAVDARATFFTMFIPSSPNTAARSRLVSRTSSDEQINRWALETIADRTGGGSYRVDVGAESAFTRLGRELSGYYRLGVERAAGDATAKPQRLKVQVVSERSSTTRPSELAAPSTSASAPARAMPSRNGLIVRARELFDVRTIEDRNWTARLSDALVSPTPATGVALRMTSYVAADPAGSGQLTLMLAGEASRMRPGPATYQVAIRNIDGGELISTEQQLGDPTDDRLPFSTNLAIAPGSYIVRLAVMDSTGQVGSVDHRVEARRVPVGSMTASGPLLVRVPGGEAAQSRLNVDGVRQDERLALQVDLEGDGERPAGAGVVFEIASNPDGPALVTTTAEISQGAGARMVLAQGIADLRVLPPGSYVARAKVKSDGATLGELRRVFTVLEAPAQLPVTAVTTAATTASATAGPTTAAAARMRAAASRPTSVKARAMETAGSFEAAHLLEPGVVGQYLDRLAVRRDVASPEARALLERAKTAALSDLVVSDALAAEAPVAAPFLRGLTLLAQGKLDPAAQAFRAAMRAGSDFYPAMVYLGACYAAGGQHKEAAGAWRTALIREGDNVRVHLLLADALMRTGRGDLALQALTRARERWPDDEALTRRYAAAAIATGLYAQGLDVVDGLIERRADDEPTLSLGLLVLYDAMVTARPVETVERDRARMTKYAEAYRARGGPSLALVETWMTEVTRRAR
jgi:VWFA-related protein